MDKPIKRLNLNRETVKTLGVKAGVRTGADYTIIAQGGVSAKTGSVINTSRGITDSCSLEGIEGLGGGYGGIINGRGH